MVADLLPSNYINYRLLTGCDSIFLNGRPNN